MTHQPQSPSPETSCDGRVGEWSQFPATPARAADAIGPSPRAVLAGLACGLLIGGLFALLMAPRKGRDTRHWLAERGRMAGRWTSMVLHRDELMGIVRRSGIVGLADWRRRQLNRPLQPLHGSAVSADRAGEHRG